jgi:hypothetical protein
MKKLWILALCLVLTLSFAACGKNPAPDKTEEDPSVSTTTTTTEPGAAPTDNGGANTTTTIPQGGNIVNGDDFFGTTTTAPTTTGTTQKGQTTTAPTTTTATKKPTTTIAPPVQEVIENVKIPAAGYDMDGKKRIVIKDSSVKTEGGKQVASFTFANVSKDNGREWIIPEYSKIKYACYDKSGKEIYAGEITLGALDYGKSTTRTVTLPAGTAEVKFTGHNLEYWTPWG